MKCSFDSCMKYFHPICIRETFFYFNISIVEGRIVSVCYCEEHSQKMLIKAYLSK